MHNLEKSIKMFNFKLYLYETFQLDTRIRFRNSKSHVNAHAFDYTVMLEYF